jgi:hypothetical protein
MGTFLLRRTWLSIPLILLVSPAFAIDKANLPSNVLDGWTRLAKAAKTRQYAVRLVSREELSPIESRVSVLDNRYVRFEERSSSVSNSNWTTDLVRVVLFDGSEYFTIWFNEQSKKAKLAEIGEAVRERPYLRVNKPYYGFVMNIDLYDAIQSESIEITSFDQSSSVVVIHRPTSPMAAKVVEAKLDPLHDYRVVSAIASIDDNTRSTEIIEYGEHLAIPLRVLSSFEVRDRETNAWSKLEGKDTVATNTITQDVVLTPSEFSIEHYGLPPYQYRSTPWYAYVLGISGGLAMLIIGLKAWRNRRA